MQGYEQGQVLHQLVDRPRATQAEGSAATRSKWDAYQKQGAVLALVFDSLLSPLSNGGQEDCNISDGCFLGRQ